MFLIWWRDSTAKAAKKTTNVIRLQYSYWIGMLNRYSSFVLFFLLLGALVGSTAKPVLTYEKCPDGFVRFQDSCYNFYVEQFSWPEAMVRKIFCIFDKIINMKNILFDNYLALCCNKILFTTIYTYVNLGYESKSLFISKYMYLNVVYTTTSM